MLMKISLSWDDDDDDDDDDDITSSKKIVPVLLSNGIWKLSSFYWSYDP